MNPAYIVTENLTGACIPLKNKQTKLILELYLMQNSLYAYFHL